MSFCDLPGVPVFCSWSGGKDSALALYEAAQAGAVPQLLVSMMIESGERSRSHGLSRRLLLAQAEAIGLPIRFGPPAGIPTRTSCGRRSPARSRSWG